MSAEAREEERGGAEEERVGGSGAREDSEQIKILQRGQALLLSKIHPPKVVYLLLGGPPEAPVSFIGSP